MMGLTVDEYLDTPALTVDWDNALHEVEKRVLETKQRESG